MATIQLKSLGPAVVVVSLLTGNREYERMRPKIRDVLRREEGILGQFQVEWELPLYRI